MKSFINDFGNVLKPGKNLNQFKAVQGYFFKMHDEIINGYRHCVADKDNERSVRGVKKSSLMKCSVCGAELTIFSVRHGRVYVRQKKHLVFNSVSGKKYHTCYSVSNCLSKIEFDGDLVDLPDPSYDNFFNREEKDYIENSEMCISMKEDFDLRVLTFIEKWTILDISKITLSEFLKDAKHVSLHIDFWPESYANTILKKIYYYIGVEL